MINKYFDQILPNTWFDSRMLYASILICLFSVVLSISFFSISVGLILCAFLLIAIGGFRLHFLQLFLIGLLISRILPGGYYQLFNSITASVIVLVLIWMSNKALMGYENFRFDPDLYLLVFAYLLLAFSGILSMIFNSNLSAFAIGEIFKFILSAIFLALFYHLLNDLQITKKIFYTLLIISIAIATYGYYLFIKIGLTPFVMAGADIMHSISGNMSNTGTLALTVLYPMPIMIAYLLYGRDKKAKRMLFMILLYIFPIWFLWNSRGNYLYFFICSVILILFHKKRFLIILIIIILIILSIITIDSVPFFRQFLRLEKGLTYRGDYWLASWRMFLESPILGKSPGYFDKFKFQYMDPGIGRIMMGTVKNMTPHNVLIMRAVDSGISGVVAQMIIWVLCIVVFFRNYKFFYNSEYNYLYLGFGALVLGNFVSSFIDVGGSMITLLFLAVIFKMPILVRGENANMMRTKINSI